MLRNELVVSFPPCVTVNMKFCLICVKLEFFKFYGKNIIFDTLIHSTLQVSGEYKWADGWPTYYTNWGYREPSQGMDEGCVVISANGTWDDTACSSNFGAVCKYTSCESPDLSYIPLILSQTTPLPPRMLKIFIFHGMKLKKNERPIGRFRY